MKAGDFQMVRLYLVGGRQVIFLGGVFRWFTMRLAKRSSRWSGRRGLMCLTSWRWRFGSGKGSIKKIIEETDQGEGFAKLRKPNKICRYAMQRFVRFDTWISTYIHVRNRYRNNIRDMLCIICVLICMFIQHMYIIINLHTYIYIYTYYLVFKRFPWNYQMFILIYTFVEKGNAWHLCVFSNIIFQSIQKQIGQEQFVVGKYTMHGWV